MAKPKKFKDGYVLVCRPWITLRNGKRIYAAAYGRKAFCFWVPVKKTGI
jgi:hypothetical protein